MKAKRLLTTCETATYLGFSEVALYQLVHRKRIPVVRIGRALRFDVLKLDDWISNQQDDDIILN